MKIAEYVGNNIVIIEPHGRLTMETIQSFRRAIARRIDQRLEPADPRPSEHRLPRQRRARRARRRLHVVPARAARGWSSCTCSGRNRELLTLTKLLTVFDVYETTLEAERSFTRPPRKCQ